MDAHEAVSALKVLAAELGRTPSRAEFERTIKGGRYAIDRHFGTYRQMLAASGLEPLTTSNKPRIGAEIFDKNIERHIEAHIPEMRLERFEYERTLFIGDTHAPFIHQPTLAAIVEFAAKHKPRRIVQVGDLYDMLSHGKFPRSHNVFTPKAEMELARGMAEKMWSDLRTAAPGAECIQLLGNHDIRPMRRLLEKAPELELFMDFERWFQFEGVRTVSDPRQEYRFDDVAVIHGYMSKIGEHRDFMLCNTVVGHQHVGGVAYRNINGKTLWEMNAGLVGDPTSKGLAYTPQRVVKWTLGFGWLDEYGPRFVPL